MLFFTKRPDGGKDSPVMGYWLVEIKPLFSIVLLKFNEGSRENYHSHAFNALTWFLKGEVEEHKSNGEIKTFKASLRPKYTPRTNCHRVFSKGITWALSFRGPWKKEWQEYNETSQEYITLTHGRKVVKRERA